MRMEYDGNGNLTRETGPLGESRSYAYTPLGEVESVTDEAGVPRDSPAQTGNRAFLW